MNRNIPLAARVGEELLRLRIERARSAAIVFSTNWIGRPCAPGSAGGRNATIVLAGDAC